MSNEHDFMTLMMQKIESIEAHLKHDKPVLNTDEAAAFLDLEKSYLFHLTSAGVIPFSKPNGKKIYFAKDDLIKWAMKNRTSGSDEKAEAAATYITLSKRKTKI